MNKSSLFLFIVVFALLFMSGCRNDAPVAPGQEDMTSQAGQTDPMQQLDILFPSPPHLPADDYPMTPEQLQQKEDRRISYERLLRVKQRKYRIPSNASTSIAWDYNKTFAWTKSNHPLFTVPSAPPNLTVNTDINVSFNVHFHWDAVTSGFTLTSTDVYAETKLVADATYEAITTGNFEGTYSKNIASDSYTFGGVIGVVPIWVDIDGQIDAGVYYKSVTNGKITQKAKATATAKIGRKWDNVNGWTSNSQPLSIAYNVYNPVITGIANFTVQPFMNFTLGASLYSVVGPRVTITPYVKIYANLFPKPRYIDRSVCLRGIFYVNLDLKIWDAKQFFNQTLFDDCKQYPRYYF